MLSEDFRSFIESSLRYKPTRSRGVGPQLKARLQAAQLKNTSLHGQDATTNVRALIPTQLRVIQGLNLATTPVFSFRQSRYRAIIRSVIEFLYIAVECRVRVEY